jgi:hypothetical protein
VRRASVSASTCSTGTPRARERERFVHPPITARPDLNPLHASGAQRFDHRVQAVDKHRFKLTADS